jgi:hypothetical protein
MQKDSPEQAAEYINKYLATMNTSLEQLGITASDFV